MLRGRCFDRLSTNGSWRSAQTERGIGQTASPYNRPSIATFIAMIAAVTQPRSSMVDAIETRRPVAGRSTSW